MKKISLTLLLMLLLSPVAALAQEITLEEFFDIAGIDEQVIGAPPQLNEVPQEILDSRRVDDIDYAQSYQDILDAYNNLFNESGLPTGFSADATIEFNPSVPDPGERVKAYIKTSTINLNLADITWSIDGSVYDSGKGVYEIDFTAPQVGDVKQVSFVLTSSNGFTVRNSKSFSTGSVTLLHEAQTFTPPFYKGKALYTTQSDVLIYAFPELYSNGARIPSDQLVFNWRINGQRKAAASGVGRDTYLHTDSLIETILTVNVEVTSLDKSITANGRLNLKAAEPISLVYENNPLYGPVFEQSVSGGFVLDRQEVELFSVPYFFSTDLISYEGATEHVWRMNGQIIDNPGFENRLVLRNEDGISGETAISVDVSNTDSERRTQRSNTSFSILFDSNFLSAPANF